MKTSQSSRRCIESDLAATILANPQLFPVIKKVSFVILYLLRNNENIKALTKDASVLNENISKQLFSNTHFGTIGKNIDNCKTPLELLALIIKTLEDDSNMPCVLHIHQIFMQSIFASLVNKQIAPIISENKDVSHTLSEHYAIKLKQLPEKIDAYHHEIVSLIFKNELFNSSTRVKTLKTGQMTKRVGIAQEGECHFNAETELHENVIEVFEPQADADWTKEITLKQLPFVAGPSGHTGSSMLLVTLLGNLNEEEMKQYVSALIGLLTGGGYHSVHEILKVAQKVGVNYESDSYTHFLPQSFLNSPAYQQLFKKYQPSTFEILLENMCYYAKGVTDTCPSYFPSSSDAYKLTSSHFFNTLQPSAHTLTRPEISGYLQIKY